MSSTTPPPPPGQGGGDSGGPSGTGGSGDLPPRPPGGGPGGTGAPGGRSGPPGRPAGFFSGLFDLSFEHFITTRVVKVLYVLAMIGSAFYALFVVVWGFQVGAGVGVLALLIGAPLVFFIGVIYARVLLELVMVIFRIASDVHRLAQRDRSDDGPSIGG